jgi:hypothetical protein
MRIKNALQLADRTASLAAGLRGFGGDLAE